MRSFRWWLVAFVVSLVAVQGCGEDVEDPRGPPWSPPSMMADSMAMICPKTWDWTEYITVDQPVILANHPALFTNLLRGKKAIDPAAGAEIEHGLSRFQGR